MQAHDHSHNRGSSIPQLRIALAVTFLILTFEALGGFFAHSLALLTDAAHMLTDVGAAALALWAAGMAKRGPDKKRTYGYGRATILAALANATALLLIVGVIVYEAILRFSRPEAVDSTIMMAIGAASIILNVALGWYLSRGESTLNVRAVIAHVAGDAVISGAVVVAAIAILFTRVAAIDPAVSILAAILVIRSAWDVLRESLNVLLEGVPQGLDVDAMRSSLRRNLPIEDVHDVHVWCVTDGGVATSLHLRVAKAQLEGAPDIVSRAKELLHHEFDVTHATVEIECTDCAAAC